MPLPPLNADGELPPGVHTATLAEVVERFGSANSQRRFLGRRLANVYRVAGATGLVARVVVFGSFVTAKLVPNDIDVFLLMEDAFDLAQMSGEVRALFTNSTAQSNFGATVFWLRRSAALRGEQAALADWQITRDGYERGIVEIVEGMS